MTGVKTDSTEVMPLVSYKDRVRFCIAGEDITIEPGRGDEFGYWLGLDVREAIRAGDTVNPFQISVGYIGRKCPGLAWAANRLIEGYIAYWDGTHSNAPCRFPDVNAARLHRMIAGDFSLKETALRRIGDLRAAAGRGVLAIIGDFGDLYPVRHQAKKNWWFGEWWEGAVRPTTTKNLLLSEENWQLLGSSEDKREL